MSMKRKRRTILKTKYQEQDKQQLMLNNVLPFDSDFLYTTTCKGCCLLNTNEYNNKLRSVIGQEYVSEVKKQTWFIQQVHDMFFCSWMVLRKLADKSNIRRAIGLLLYLVYAPLAGMRNSVRSTTSFFHSSMVVNSGLNDPLRLRKFIHEGLLS